MKKCIKYFYLEIDYLLSLVEVMECIAVNIIALVLIIAVSFIAGFGVAKLVGPKIDKDKRPALEQMNRDSSRQRGSNMQNRKRGRSDQNIDEQKEQQNTKEKPSETES